MRFETIRFVDRQCSGPDIHPGPDDLQLFETAVFERFESWFRFSCVGAGKAVFLRRTNPFHVRSRPMIAVRLFLKLDAETRIGHGKVSLLEAIAATGSISGAGRELGMTYRRAWELVDHLNKAFGRPLVAGQSGGAGGGGAQLTDLGREVVARYRAILAATEAAAAPHVDALTELMAASEAQDGLDDGC
jgi:molybdate transport system regulatory protein